MENNKKRIINISILALISLIATVNLTTNYNNNQKRANLLPTSQNQKEAKEEKEEKEVNEEKETIEKEEIKEQEPQPEEHPVVESETDKINKLFSADINVALAKEEYNNKDIIGRLEIPGLFNLIVTQSTDNEYYSNHNVNRRKDIKGNEFLDYRNTPNDSQINIYGHNSRTYDIPFRKLEKFLNRDFFNNNQFIMFQTDTVRRIYQIIAIKKTGSNYNHMDIYPTNKHEHITNLISNAINSRQVPYTNETNIIVLQTCVENDPGNYYIIVGFEI